MSTFAFPIPINEEYAHRRLQTEAYVWSATPSGLAAMGVSGKALTVLSAELDGDVTVSSLAPVFPPSTER